MQINPVLASWRLQTSEEGRLGKCLEYIYMTQWEHTGELSSNNRVCKRRHNWESDNWADIRRMTGNLLYKWRKEKESKIEETECTTLGARKQRLQEWTEIISEALEHRKPGETSSEKRLKNAEVRLGRLHLRFMLYSKSLRKLRKRYFKAALFKYNYKYSKCTI